MKKRLVLLVASFFMTVFGCVGCLGNMAHSNTNSSMLKEETKLDIKRSDLEQIGEIVLAEFGSNMQKRIRNKDSLYKVADILESIVLKKKNRQDGPPGTIFIVTCDQIDFSMSLQVGGLYYRGTYYEPPPNLLEQLQSVYKEAPEAAEQSHWF